MHNITQLLVLFMDLKINLRIKTLNARIPLLQVKSEVRAIAHSSSTK